jgi:hypothetical protein
VRALSSQLQKALVELKGVRKVTANPTLARLSVFYDPWATTDRPYKAPVGSRTIVIFLIAG